VHMARPGSAAEWRARRAAAALVRTSDDAIISLSTDFRITSWNRGAQKLLGYTAGRGDRQAAVDLYIPSGRRAMGSGEAEPATWHDQRNPEAVRLLELPLQGRRTILDRR